MLAQPGTRRSLFQSEIGVGAFVMRLSCASRVAALLPVATSEKLYHLFRSTAWNEQPISSSAHSSQRHFSEGLCCFSAVSQLLHSFTPTRFAFRLYG
eukprot:s1645_g18.t1